MHRQAWEHSDAWFSRNWETVAAPFGAECPTLTRAELKALAQNAWDVHINGDSTIRAGIAEVDLEALRTQLRGYPPELAGANNKTALIKAGTSANFTAQPANIERLQAQHLTPEDFALLSEREPELARRAVTFGQFGDNRTKGEILDDAARLCEAKPTGRGYSHELG